MDFDNRFSNMAQRRLDSLLSQADTNFDYSWMRQAMFKELRRSVNDKSGYTQFTNRLHDDKDMQFIVEYFMAYKSSLGDIIDECQNPYEDEDVVIGLAKEREQLIEAYAKENLSREWDKVNAVFPDSWRAFAHRRNYASEDDLKALRRFLRLVDRISIITDILNNREQCYGLKLNYMYYKRYAHAIDTEGESMSREELKQLLLKAIDECRAYFWANTSMGVVFSVCKEDCGFEDNASEFERFMQDVLKDLKVPLDYGCPQNTIASAKQSGEYLKYPISQWHLHGVDKKALALLNNLRQSLRAAASESEKS